MPGRLFTPSSSAPGSRFASPALQNKPQTVMSLRFFTPSLSAPVSRVGSPALQDTPQIKRSPASAPCSPRNSPPPGPVPHIPDAEDGSDWNWYLNSWGLISRDGMQMLDLRDSLNDKIEADDTIEVDDPVFYTRTLLQAAQFLPRLREFRRAFKRIPGRVRRYRQTRRIYWVIDGDPMIYKSCEEADYAWKRQTYGSAAVYATTIFHDAVRRVQDTWSVFDT